MLSVAESDLWLNCSEKEPLATQSKRRLSRGEIVGGRGLHGLPFGAASVRSNVSRGWLYHPIEPGFHGGPKVLLHRETLNGGGGGSPANK